MLVSWTGRGFAVGSALFALGVPLSLTSLPPVVSAWTYVAGSVFFTAAATLQFLTSRTHLAPEAEPARRVLAVLARPRTLDWTASAVQLVGTVAFNVTTVRAAIQLQGDAAVSTSAVWRPDAFGSVLFLVSSALAMAPEIRWRRHRHARDRSWAIATLNLVGSVFFGLSAIGAYTPAGSSSVLSEAWSNTGTLLGALCFLVGGLLLIPRHRPA